MRFDLIIVTPRGQAFSGAVERVVLPGSEGDFGVLPSHERFLTPLRIGAVEIRTGSETLWAAIADGFAEVTGEAVTVLVESCELAHEIDTAQAEHARERAEEGLAALNRDEDAERYAQYEAALEHARIRVKVSERSTH
ncbi:MAG: ATP synthase F1 subunit epsilon [Myxococcales bacterium]|nr:ATP synthase F1 subunit epsilon [Myxococcales bacterium]MDH5567863.1 ATP synthase F1 subunit epsilon [Myxococcales bacterium]